MLVDVEKLKGVLDKGIVEITFISLNSGITHTREYTTCDKHMPIPNHVKSYSGDKLLVWDVEFKKWEDIQVDTLEDFKTLEKL